MIGRWGILPAVSLFLISESRDCFQTLSIFQVQLENRWFTRNTGRIPRKPGFVAIKIMQNHANTFFFPQFASEFDILFPSEFLPHFLSDLFYVLSMAFLSISMGFLWLFYGLPMDCPFRSQPRFLLAAALRRSRQEELRRLEEQRHLARQLATL